MTIRWMSGWKQLRFSVPRGFILLTAGVWTSLGLGCHLLPSVPAPPSKKEKAVGQEYVGKTFVTIEDAYLYPGFSPSLRTRPPTAYDRPDPVPAGTRFVVRRVELNHGVVGNSLLGLAATPFGGAEMIGEGSDVLFVDLYLDSKVRKSVRMEKDLNLGGRPMFRPVPSG